MRRIFLRRLDSLAGHYAGLNSRRRATTLEMDTLFLLDAGDG